MGYTTTFSGGFIFDKPLTAKLQKEVNDFAKTRHNPRETPGYYCQWVITQDYYGEEALVWDEGEKFYNYVEWLQYLIENFFEPEGYVLDGEVEYQGEESDDFGTIQVKNNIVTKNYGIHVMDLSEINDAVLIKEIERRGYCVQ